MKYSCRKAEYTLPKITKTDACIKSWFQVNYYSKVSLHHRCAHPLRTQWVTYHIMSKREDVRLSAVSRTNRPKNAKQ